MRLQNILDDYTKNFNGKICVLETNYKKIPTIRISFHCNDLYHLLGLHKILKNINADRVISKIQNGDITFKDIQRHSDFGDIKPRIENYNFLHQLFIDNRVKICVLKKDLIKNTMNLDVVFYKPKNNRCIVLGLRQQEKVYYLTTLHEAHSDKYIHLKQTKINCIRWED